MQRRKTRISGNKNMDKIRGNMHLRLLARRVETFNDLIITQLPVDNATL